MPSVPKDASMNNGPFLNEESSRKATQDVQNVSNFDLAHSINKDVYREFAIELPKT